MREELMSVMREFYHDGIPEGVVSRDVEYAEKLRAATVVKGMRRTGKTFLTYGRMKSLVDDGIPLGRIVHVNFEDERLSGLKVDDLRLIGEVHAISTTRIVPTSPTLANSSRIASMSRTSSFIVPRPPATRPTDRKVARPCSYINSSSIRRIRHISRQWRRSRRTSAHGPPH